ncbi:MAG TPA: hypothetical protein VM912_14215 [Terriglobales bacterium]|nr:hypothetical protein [Terriglobales bacterium]
MKPTWFWNHPYLWLIAWIILIAGIAIAIDILRFLGEHARTGLMVAKQI